MASDLAKIPELSPDILQLVFQQLAGDNETLLSISLTCHAWRWLALPALYQVIDISSHNNGHLPQHEYAGHIAYADQLRGEYHQQNLLPRQRAFLRNMTEEPQLARLVKSLTWTLIWRDFEETTLAEIDRQTWCVFGKMVNVTRVDLASLHEVEDDMYVRRTPAGLFPKTRRLRLLGWMHRGLVKSILASLDPSRLLSLELDDVQDEGALPNGDSICADFVSDHAHHARSKSTDRWPNPNLARVSSSEVYHDDLIERQEIGQAYIFPGPMWLPLHTHPLSTATRLADAFANQSAAVRFEDRSAELPHDLSANGRTHRQGQRNPGVSRRRARRKRKHVFAPRAAVLRVSIRPRTTVPSSVVHGDGKALPRTAARGAKRELVSATAQGPLRRLPPPPERESQRSRKSRARKSFPGDPRLQVRRCDLHRHLKRARSALFRGIW